MNARFSAPTGAIVSPDCVRETIQKILRAAQVRFTDEELSEASGVDARAIKSYRVEGREPSLSRALSLLCVLGGGDLNRILNLVGYSARPHYKFAARSASMAAHSQPSGSRACAVPGCRPPVL